MKNKIKEVKHPLFQCWIRLNAVLLTTIEEDRTQRNLLLESGTLLPVFGLRPRLQWQYQNGRTPEGWAIAQGYPRTDKEGRLTAIDKLTSFTETADKCFRLPEGVSAIVSGSVAWTDGERIALRISARNKNVKPFFVTVIGDAASINQFEVWRFECAIDADLTLRAVTQVKLKNARVRQEESAA